MVTETVSNAERRGRLSRDRVLRAALSHADAGGLEALSMRRLTTLHDFMVLCGADFVANTVGQAAVGPAGAEPTPDWRYVLVAVRNNGTGRQQHHTPNANLPSEVSGP